jgi:hypothetical protein
MSITFENGYQIVSDKPFYSNFSSYIVSGVRQASTGDLVRTNISTTRRFVVTQPITFTGFRMIRITQSTSDNWSQLTYGVTGTLSVVAGSGGTIDGGSSNKSFETKSRINNPSVVSQRVGGSLTQWDIYDVRPVNNSTTTLTAGEYNFGIFGTGANMIMATLTNSLFPINTSRKIYPASNVATHFPIEIF